MKRLKHTMLALSAAFALLILSSCPATPQSLDASEDKPYIDPAIPQNLQVLNGLDNRIVLNWDPVEAADYYIIEYASADEPSEYQRLGTSTINSFEVSVNSGNGAYRLDPNQKYDFTVRAVTYFGTIPRESAASDFVTGAMAPTEIEYLVFPTMDDVRLIWFSPNQYTDDGEALYDATYEIKYSDTESDSSGEEIIQITEPNTNSLILGINANGLVYNHVYDFIITMKIVNDEGGTIDVESEVVTARISENYSPDQISEYTVENDRIDYIGLSWEVPQWAYADLGRDYYYFRIERQDLETREWTTILDEEILDNGNPSHSDEIEVSVPDENTENGNIFSCSFKDNTAEPGKKYKYWVHSLVIMGDDSALEFEPTIGRDDTGAEEAAVHSAEAYLYYPEAGNVTVDYTPDGPARSNVSISFAGADDVSAKELVWGIQKYMKHPEDEEYSSNGRILADETWPSGATASFIEERLMNGTETCSKREHQIYYSLMLYKADGSPYCEMEKLDSDILTLKNPELIAAESLASDNNRKEKIEFRWTMAGADVSDIDFSYRINNGEKVTLSAYTLGTQYSAVVDYTETAPVSFTLYASAMDGQYFSMLTRDDFRILVFPDDFSLQASDHDYPDKVRVAWNSTNAISNSVKYSYQYKVDEGEWSEAAPVDIFNNSYLDIPKNEIDQYLTVEVKMIASNTAHENESIESASVAGTFLSAPKNIEATKAASADTVTITWDASEKAHSYEIGRYAEEGKEPEIIGTTSATSYDYKPEDNSKPYFTVRALNSEGTATAWQTEFGNAIENIFGEKEAPNYGYILLTPELKAESIKGTDGYYLPYVKLTWDRVEGATEYVLSVLGEEITIKVDRDHNSNFTEGTPDQSGYLTYTARGTGEGTYTYLDGSGTLRDSLDLPYSITAKNDNASSAASSDSARRQLKAVEYVNLLNSAIFNNMKASGIFDWWTGSASTGGSTGDHDRNIFEPGNGFNVYSTHGASGWVWESANPDHAPNQGYIKLDKFKPYGDSLEFNSRNSGDYQFIRIFPVADSSGYLTRNNLAYIGYEGNLEESEKQGYVDIVSNYGYCPATIYIHKIDINSINPNGDSYYIVTISGQAEQNIPDSADIVRPY